VRDDFDETAQQIQKLTAKCTPKVRKDLDHYIDGLRTIATGTIELWYVFYLFFSNFNHRRPIAGSHLGHQLTRPKQNR
jgi:hypothetical protein